MYMCMDARHVMDLYLYHYDVMGCIRILGSNDMKMCMFLCFHDMKAFSTKTCMFPCKFSINCLPLHHNGKGSIPGKFQSTPQFVY